MPGPLNLFPVRVPIGRAVGPDGRSFDVLMTSEFARALSDLLVRVGGPSSINLDDVAMLSATAPPDNAGAAALRLVNDLALRLVAADQATARISALERRIEDLARLVNSSGPAPVDWEHPGKIGAATANSGSFTTLKATGQTDLKPTGAALLTIQPAAPGQIDNMELGKTTPRPARVTTLNKMTFTQPANAATLTIADGKTLSVANYMELRSVDGAVLNFGMGGTLGSAAYENTAAFAARTNTGLAPAATDPASTQTLANSLRAALISVGIGT